MTDKQQQAQIRAALEVVDPATFDATTEAERRIGFLASYLEKTSTKGLVLGISGGVDSTVGGRLAQRACERVREHGGEATFIAVRLPYQVQKDEHDAQAALDFIAPDEVWTVDIGPSVDANWEALLAAGLPRDDPRNDYHRGNVKARHRMVTQFAIAGARGLLVVGTDQAAEACVGFYTKFGDGAADLTPLFGLPKRRVKQIARHLGAPEQLVEKIPTADLENDKPLLADEIALGVRYDVVDDYLEGQDICTEDEQTILGWYYRTAHKRALPITPDGFLKDRRR
ncbi:MAG: ammonia-dependent NAD(+) synthetase [Ornithinimicrobium sp.]|uniref:ammonia-dependent NAD(+) synthetase n=1 Tax=Ornithinimicrobium sp. TaxID=1977084 RepID=UPI0026DF1938|nr:ammonia-dependent NAD(+) synthetase [Ornithinimicrobium sp.]MDO5740090.1 ammonia-dependent NAD(+) synthetase [Ornithinimicrobium sp.]